MMVVMAMIMMIMMIMMLGAVVMKLEDLLRERLLCTCFLSLERCSTLSTTSSTLMCVIPTIILILMIFIVIVVVVKMISITKYMRKKPEHMTSSPSHSIPRFS